MQDNAQRNSKWEKKEIEDLLLKCSVWHSFFKFVIYYVRIINIALFSRQHLWDIVHCCSCKNSFNNTNLYLSCQNHLTFNSSPSNEIRICLFASWRVADINWPREAALTAETSTFRTSCIKVLLITPRLLYATRSTPLSHNNSVQKHPGVSSSLIKLKVIPHRVTATIYMQNSLSSQPINGDALRPFFCHCHFNLFESFFPIRDFVMSTKNPHVFLESENDHFQKIPKHSTLTLIKTFPIIQPAYMLSSGFSVCNVHEKKGTKRTKSGSKSHLHIH